MVPAPPETRAYPNKNGHRIWWPIIKKGCAHCREEIRTNQAFPGSVPAWYFGLSALGFSPAQLRAFIHRLNRKVIDQFSVAARSSPVIAHTDLLKHTARDTILGIDRRLDPVKSARAN